MRIINYVASLVLVFGFAVTSNHSIAQNQLGLSAEEMAGLCGRAPVTTDIALWGETEKAANQIQTDLCENKIGSYTELAQRVVLLINDLDEIVPKTPAYIAMKKDAFYLASSSGQAPQLFLEHSPTTIGFGGEEEIVITSEATTPCSAQKWACWNEVSAFEKIYTYAHKLLSDATAVHTLETLEMLDNQWERFLEKSKSQTIWELWVNSEIFYEESGEHKFKAPPSWQLVLLHPNIIIENVSDALDGEQLKEGLMVEVLGADWWVQDKWYLPSGGAFIATYSDRAGVEDWGYGISVNFASKFTIGAADHGGDIGYFVTVDLLKLLQDKKSVYESYRDKL